MTNNNGIEKLRFVLKLAVFFNLFYGIGFLFVPGMLVAMSGESSLPLGWIRWSGGPLFAIGIGAIQVHRNPAKQGVFMTIAIMAALTVGLGLLYSKIFDHSTVYTWFHMTPCVINLLMFGLLLWARQGAKEILK